MFFLNKYFIASPNYVLQTIHNKKKACKYIIATFPQKATFVLYKLKSACQVVTSPKDLPL